MEDNTYIMGIVLPGNSHHYGMNNFSALPLSLQIQFRQSYTFWLVGQGMK